MTHCNGRSPVGHFFLVLDEARRSRGKRNIASVPRAAKLDHWVRKVATRIAQAATPLVRCPTAAAAAFAVAL
jgi:hypothetical protein